MKTQKPRKKLSKKTKTATQRWLQTKQGQKWLAQKQQEQLDRELLHQMNAWL